ncbi:MAG: alpha-beta hydrolase superfamily lysophospholipase [Myxococcota bacterium]|jgi:alpha-beta hydrolase superfamily lysophospholipase
MQTLALSHGDTRLVVDGVDGAVVLFVHGMTYPLEVFGPLAAAVAASGRSAIRFDLYGRGRSGWDGTGLTATVLAQQAREVLDAVRPRAAVHLVGLSNADLVLNAFAAAWPDRTRSLTWIAPSGIDPRTMRASIRTLGRIPLVARLLGGRLRRQCAARMASHRAHLPADAPPEAAAAYEAALHTVQTSPHFAGAVASHLTCLPLPAQVQRDAEAVAGLPVLMLTFADESDATEAGIAPLRAAVPGLHTVEVPRGTHMALIERPDDLIPHLLQFLDASE